MKQNEGGIFINGKAQVIEMLQLMDPESKETLLKNIRKRNPQMANELVLKSITFMDIIKLNDTELRGILNLLNPQIMGIALKGVNRELQRRILRVAERDYAEEAYNVMMAPISNEDESIKRGQEKVLSLLVRTLRSYM